MLIFNRFWAIFRIAAKRILSQPGMAVATTLGMIFAISLTMSVPLYASSVYNAIFLQRIDDGPRGSRIEYPPFSFMFTYDSNVTGNLQWQDLAQINEYIAQQTGPMVGLPVKIYTRYFATNPLALFPHSVEAFPNNEKPLIWSSLAFMDNIQEHVNIGEGRLPQLTSDGPIEVMIHVNLATELGLQVGEVYNMFATGQAAAAGSTTKYFPVRIVGVFQPNNPDEEYWFIRPDFLKERLIVTEEIFDQQVSPLLSDEIYTAFWSILMDGSEVRPDQAMTLVRRINNFQKECNERLPRIKLPVSPVDSLYSYQSAANLLTVLLFAFSVPIFGLLLAFITMTSGMTVERQRNEIAILRSRGAMLVQMIGISIVECLLLSVVALLIAIPLSAGIAWAIGRTRSFLDFSAASGPNLIWDPATIWFAVGAILLTMLARLLPTIRAARDNIVIYKRERARTLRTPFWQRMWLDVLLMIPAGYGLYQLQQSGSIDVFGASAKGDPFTNPLLIMVPALAIFALSLFFLRLMPFFMSAITWITARTRLVGLMMAARHLARTPSSYTLPLVLLMLTLSLSAFTATLAGTLDHHLQDQMNYKVGADIVFQDLGDAPESESSMAPTSSLASNTDANTGLNIQEENPPGWFFLPVTEYLRLPEIKEVTRVGRYDATAIFGGEYENGEILGVDWYNFPSISFWRSDFADESLGELMNRLATLQDGILVTKAFAARHSLVPGDLITLSISSYQEETSMDFHIAGTFELFPTYYPGTRTLFIANLDYIFMSLGAEYPYHVWAKATNPAMPHNLKELSWTATSQIGARTLNWEEPIELITSEQSRPERQGLFGILSVGFAAAAVLTVLGFLLYALLSYQRRFVELGVLRAVGLSAGQMTVFLAAELAFLILMGGLIGTGLGVWISNNFIPYLQIGAEAQAQIPPYVVYIAWPSILRVYALFGLLFIVALGTLMVMLRRMKIFQAIKMGESV
jgi:putative ABC transport system permease protein